MEYVLESQVIPRELRRHSEIDYISDVPEKWKSYLVIVDDAREVIVMTAMTVDDVFLIKRSSIRLGLFQHPNEKVF